MARTPPSKVLNNDKPRQLGAQCHVCPFAHNGNPRKPVVGFGPVNCVGIVIGEAPGKEESEAGRPFVGPAAQGLREALSQAGLSLDKMYRVFACMCAPQSKADVRYMQRAVDACRPAFIKQVEALETVPVLALGTWALYAWTGKRRFIDRARGFVRNVPLNKKVAANDDGSRTDDISSEADESFVDAG